MADYNEAIKIKDKLAGIDKVSPKGKPVEDNTIQMIEKEIIQNGDFKMSYNVDQTSKGLNKQDLLIGPLQQGLIPQEDNGILNEKKEQKEKCKIDSSCQFHITKSNIFVQVILTSTMFMIIVSICWILLPQYVAVIVFCAIIPILFIMFTLLHCFFRQKETSSNPLQTEVKERENTTLSG